MLVVAANSSVAADPRRWLILATLVAGQFIYVVDAFIVNAAVPTIRADPHASAAEIEAVIAVYQIANAAGVAVVGGIFFGVAEHGSASAALLAALAALGVTIGACAVTLTARGGRTR